MNIDTRRLTCSRAISRSRSVLLVCLMAFTWFAAAPAQSEQKQQLGPYEAHYVVVNTLFFSEEIARRYEVVRGRDRALINLSFLDESGTPVPVALTGTVTNLLGQVETLEFREVRERPAIYYLADIRFTDRDTLRFRIQVETPDGQARTLSFQQQMFWEGR